MGGVMGGLGLWVRSEWRRGWRALLGLALLVSIGGGATMAAWAGARRADTSFDRFVSQVSGVLAVSAAGVEADVAVFDDTWALAPVIAEMPGVSGVTPTAWMAVAFEIDGEPQTFFSVATAPGVGSRPPPGSSIVDGRAAIAADEVVLNEAAANASGLGVGDTIVLRSYAPDQIDAFVNGGLVTDRGPRIQAKVAGISRSAEDISDNPEPFVVLSSQFYDNYAAQIAHCDCSLWVAAEPSDVDQVATGLSALVADRPLVVERINEQLKPRVERAVGLEVGALRIAALVAALSAGLVMAQAVARHVNGHKSTTALAAIGATRTQISRGWTIILAPSAFAGALAAIAVATALSPVFPQGLARRAEVAPGLRFDAVVLIGGSLVTAAAVLLTAAIVSWRATRAEASPAPRAAANGRIAALGSPVAGMGARFALNPSHDRSRVAMVTTVASLAMAIGAPIAVALIERSIDDVLETPSAFAADWDMQLLAQPEDPEALIAAVAAEPSVEAFAVQYQAPGNQWTVSGQEGTALVAPVAFDAMVGSMGPILQRGRLPETEVDVVIGAAIARLVGADIGDDLSVDSGLAGKQTFRVSGIGTLSDGDDVDTSFVTTPEGLGRLHGAERDIDVNGAFVRLAPTGRDGDATRTDARRRLEAIGFADALPPSRVATLEQIGSVPRLLAMALVALGFGAVIHSLLVARSGRQLEIAIAKALGFTRRQAASTIRWQGAVTFAIAAAVGVPTGLFVGRVVWKQVAGGVGATDLVSIPWPTIVVTPLVWFPVVVGAATLVGIKAARVNSAAVLRSE